ncbi:hypothetical protein ACFQ9X_28935 [Catenulispora yoronensis]
MSSIVVSGVSSLTPPSGIQVFWATIADQFSFCPHDRAACPDPVPWNATVI